MSPLVIGFISPINNKIIKFYADESGNLEPYQLLLRDAQRAHTRGDKNTEAALYRRVLGMLRVEGRRELQRDSLTSRAEHDRELEQAISIVLRRE